jgi:hypothetical protein
MVVDLALRPLPATITGMHDLTIDSPRPETLTTLGPMVSHQDQRRQHGWDL